MRNSKGTSETLWIVISVVIVILILLFSTNLLGKSFTPLVNKFSKCSSSGGYWSTKPTPTDDFEVQSKLIQPRKIDGSIEYCYVPIPGFKTEFEKAHEKEIKETASKETKSKTTTKPGQTSSKVPSLELNGKIKYFQPVANPNLYDSALTPNVVLYKEDDNKLQINQDFKEGLEKCKVTIRPSEKYRDSSGASKLRQVKNLGSNEDYVVSIEKTNCEKKLLVDVSKLKALKNTLYKDPGLYKMDYYYWLKGADEKTPQVRIAYLKILPGKSDIGASSPGSKEVPTQIKLFERKTSGSNEIICTLSVARDGDSKAHPLKMMVNFSSMIERSNPNSERIYVLNKNHPRVVFNFEINLSSVNKKSLTEEKEYSFKDCSEVDFEPLSDNGFPSCDAVNPSAICPSYSKTQCNNPQERDGSVCATQFAKCYWKWALPVGSCLECGNKITKCSDYNNQKTCELNPCLADGTMNDRCFYDKQCRVCVYPEDKKTDSCNEYTSEKLCERDPCGFGTYEGQSVCVWEHNKCSKESV